MLGLSGSPQETDARADKKPTLWAVSSEPLLDAGALQAQRFPLSRGRLRHQLLLF